MRIVIVGAGIAGLAAAAGLSGSGHEVTVVERAGRLEPVGAGIALVANGYRALDHLGVGDRLRMDVDPGWQGGQRTPSGRMIMPIPIAPDYGVVHRSALHAVLFEAASGAEFRFGHEVVGIDDAGVVIRPSDRGADTRRDPVEAIAADLVVGADGIRSIVRSSMPDDPGLRYSGYSAWRGVTETTVDMAGRVGESWGYRERFGYVPLADGRAYWFGVASLPAGTVFPDEAAEVARRFSKWHEPIPALLAATPPERVIRHDIDELRRPLRSYVRGRVVLVGDAAHAMTPNLGQGGGQGLEDAVTLSALLAGADAAGVPAALAEYDRLRRPRSQAIARRSRNIGRIAHLRGRATVPVRDALLRLTPASALESATRELTDWEPPAV